VLKDWQRCKPWLEEALRYSGGTHTMGDIESAIRRKEMALIPRESSAFVIERIQYPQLAALHIFLAAGELEELKHHSPVMDDIARRLHCERITIAGRAGFKRALKDCGFEPRWTVLSKEVS